MSPVSRGGLVARPATVSGAAAPTLKGAVKPIATGLVEVDSRHYGMP